MPENAVVRRLRARRRRNAPPTFERLTADQDGPLLQIRFTVGEHVTPSALWARDLTDTWHPLGPVTARAGRQYAVTLDLRTLPAPDEEDGTALVLAVEVEERLPAGSAVVAQHADDPAAAVSSPIDGTVVVRRRAPLGEARHTEVRNLHAIATGSGSAAPYPSALGILSILVYRPLKPYGQVYVQRLRLAHGTVQLRGRLATRHGDVRSAHLVLKGRTSGARLSLPLPLRFDGARSVRTYGHRFYDYDVRLDATALLKPPHLADDTYDAWIRLTTAQNPEPFQVRVGRTRMLIRWLTRPGWAQQGDEAVAVNPYYTFKAKRTSFHVHHLDAGTAAYLRSRLRLRHLDRLLHPRREIWLVGERPYKAQDNGYWFFRYLRENHPELAAYYVIERDSPERANVEPLGNVVDFGSKEHIRLTLQATKIVGTHHPDFLYPMRTEQFTRAVRATRVFLQHGVMGTKWMADLYGKWVTGFDTDLFVVSSEREKEYIVGDFGYPPDEVVVTGLPRFDHLFAGDVEVRPRQVLVMPTWRDWLQDLDVYAESEFHETWSRFLHHPELRALVEAEGLEIVFCLHPNMQQYRHLFDDVPAKVVGQGEIDVQQLLKQSAMLVTDYSSVGFDFSFLGKPVTYFQFDRERFLAPYGSHLELDEELPGPIFRTAERVIDEIRARLAEHFATEPEYEKRADRFIAHRDRRNSERVYEAVRAAAPRRRLRERVKRTELVRLLPQAVRRHRLYFPVVRRMFPLLQRLPADDRLVLFESGIGKQFADSPRYIYEELVRRRPDLVKVWAYNGRLRTADPNTRVVERLSPRYFWYLARARYWVNNQSFPHYVTRRRDGVYVQTWHGTPLKRMLHDLPEVHGRDLGYVDRASSAAGQWSVLVSPNSFTTERMRSAFGYTGRSLELGYPRNDVLHRPDRDQIAARARARLGLQPEQKVVLYAPTFRDDQTSGGRFVFRLPFDLDRLHRDLGGDTVLLLRMHVLVAEAVEIPAHLRDFVRDVSSYPEIQELYLAADVLVTDYSSVFFDFAQLRRPVVFYAYDLADYRDKLRGFYLDYSTELPGPIVETEDELVHALSHLDEVEAASAERRESFLERFAAHDDGHAAERVVDAIFGPRSD